MRGRLAVKAAACVSLCCILSHHTGQTQSALCPALLRAAERRSRAQCAAQQRAEVAGMPLWQLRWGAQAAPALLAARAPYAAAVFTVAAAADLAHGARGRPGEQAAGRLGRGRAGPLGPDETLDPNSGGPARWALVPAAALRTKRRLAHLAWNRMLHSELALVCEGGALHVADVAAAGGGPLPLGFQGTPFQAALVAQRVGAPEDAAGPACAGRGRAVCEWAPHPRMLLSTRGAHA
jgi:hypothetical protein